MECKVNYLRDATKCSAVPYKNTPPSEILTADINNHPTSGEPRIFSQLHPPPVIKEHKHPFGIKNPKFQCYLNSVLQLIFFIFRKTSYTSPFNSSTDGVLLKCFLKTAHTAWSSKDVDTLKFRFVHHDSFYNGQIQQVSSECLLILIDIINKGSMPDSSPTIYPTGNTLSDILFSFMLEKYIKCDVCKLRSPSFESTSVLYITPTYTTSLQDLIL